MTFLYKQKMCNFFLHRGVLHHEVLPSKWLFDVNINFENVLLGVLQNQIVELRHF